MQMFRKRAVAASLVVAGLVLAHAGAAQAADGFTLSSPSFKDGEFLALKNAGNNKANPNCKGENVSPPLAWSNVPAGTRSFAMVMVDPQGRAGQGVDHWIAYGIPASVTSFAEGEVSKGSDKFVGGKGTAGLGTYTGPCTPPGAPHHYNFTLIATDLDPKELPPGLTRDELLAKLVGHGKDAAGLVGLFRYPQ